MEEPKEYGLVDKKIMAIEIHKELNKSTVTNVISIVGFFLIALFSIINKWAGAICSGILCSILAFTIRRAKLRMSYLETTYNVEKPKPFLNLSNLK